MTAWPCRLRACVYVLALGLVLFVAHNEAQVGKDAHGVNGVIRIELHPILLGSANHTRKSARAQHARASTPCPFVAHLDGQECFVDCYRDAEDKRQRPDTHQDVAVHVFVVALGLCHGEWQHERRPKPPAIVCA